MVERMTALDATFLVIERRNRPMHVGAVILLQPGPEGFDSDRLFTLLRERLHLVPRYRQKVRAVPGHIANPVWVDDPAFDFDFHVHHRSLPKPGSQEQLFDLAGLIFSRSLDRSRPLWEYYLVDGLADGQVAVLVKTHHCMVDGMAAVEMLSSLVDLTADPRRMDAEPWNPEPEPTDAELLKAGLLDQVRQPVQAVEAVREWAANASENAKQTASTAAGLVSAGKRARHTSADTPLVTPSTEWRRYRTVTHSLADYKKIKSRLGGTVNDVAVSVVTGAIRSWLLNRDVEIEGDDTIRIMLPVSMHQPGAPSSTGNQVSAMFIDAPVGLADPLARYRAVQSQTDVIKKSGAAAAPGTMAPAADFIAPNLFALAARLTVHTDVLDTVVTNVPGPQFPLYLNGATITAMHPFVTTYPNRALTHGVLSYNGKMCWGLIGERDELYDFSVYAGFFDSALAELDELADAPQEA